MTLRSIILSFTCITLGLAIAGCRDAPGKPAPGTEIGRPEQLLSFAPLYRQNCSGCHGSDGKGGAAMSLANPVYLATAGVADMERITSVGVAGTLMPGFSKHAGGMLTDQQVHILAQGMLIAWGKPDALGGSETIAYESSSLGDAAEGHKAFTVFCARCHGQDGAGSTLDKATRTGSLVDPAYLSLVSDQSLRSTIIAGLPEQGMPDWRSDFSGPGAMAMTQQEITDTVAWLASHRLPTPGQPYLARHSNPD